MKNLILTLIITLPLTLWGQGWEQTYGFGYIGYSVQQTTDGGIIILGNTTSYFEDEDNDVYLIKTNEDGEELWSHPYGSEDGFKGYSIQQTTDGGYIITGYITSFESGYKEAYLIKTDINGNEQWSQTFSEFYDGNWGELYNTISFSVQQTSDGGYIITGKGETFFGISIIILIKTDEYGEVLWSQSFGQGEGHSVQQTTDGGYIITGYGVNDVYLIKTDENGNEIWSQNFYGFNWDIGFSVQQTSDGGYIITGIINFQANSPYIFLIKTDEYGEELWSQWFEGGEGYSVQQTSDGGYIIVGSKSFFGNDNDDVYLIKTNDNGEELWSQTFGGEGKDRGYSIQETTDGGYIIIGSKYEGTNKIYLIKTDGYGNIFPYVTSLSGCDSVQSLINETFFIENGTYIDTLTNVYGGDSVIVQEIEIYNNPENIVIEGNTEVFNSILEIYQIINPNNSIEWNIYGGTISDIDENLIEVLWGNEGIGYVEVIETNNNSCSTTSILEVIISNNSPVSNYYLNGCDSVQNLTNESFIFESGTYIDTLTNVFGGDSVVIREIEILNSPESIQINGNENVLPTSLEFYQIININNNIQWNIEGGSIYENQNNIIQVLWGNEGIGYVEVTETDNNGCSTTSTLEVTISNEPTNIHEYNKTRKLIKTINLLGQEIKPQKNQSYIEIYDDGTRKRKIIIE